MAQQKAGNEPVMLPRHTAHAINADYLWMTLPLLAMAVYLYGLRCAALCGVAVLTANICDRMVAVMRSLPYDKTENSSITIAMILTMLFPASVSYYTVIVSVMAAVFLGKAAFGGYGAYPFNPVALGYAVAAVSWPKNVFRYPVPFTDLTVFTAENATFTDSAASTLRLGGLPNISLFNLFLGNYAGSMGITAVLVLLSCAMFLWVRKRITLSAPVGFLATCALIAYLFPRLGGIGLALPWHYVDERLMVMTYELLSGAILYGAVFLINDPVTSPKNEWSRLIYGILTGIATMMFGYYGQYDLGVCFAVLIVNAISGGIDRFVWRVIGRKEAQRVEQ